MSGSNPFVDFVREQEDVELADFTRDGYMTVFVEVDTSDPVWDELVDLAMDEGYSHFGLARRRDTGQPVEVFSMRDESNLALSSIYLWER